jgi:hypothetical protein
MLHLEHLESRWTPSFSDPRFIASLGETEFTTPRFAVGSDVGGDATVKVYGRDAMMIGQRLVFEPGYTGGVRSAMADVNADGVADLIAATGFGGGPRVRVIDGKTDRILSDFFAYEDTFRGGVNVAAGDLDGDGRAEILVGAGVGGGPRIRGFRFDGSPVLDQFVYADTLRDGVHVAAGDLDGDGRAEVLTGAARGGGPHVRVMNSSGAAIRDFFAYDPALRGGLHIAAGDIDGDGRAEIVTAPGEGGRPHIRTWDLNGRELSGFFANTNEGNYGTPIQVSTPGPDGKSFIIAGYGPGGPGSIEGFRAGGARAFITNPFGLDHINGVAFGAGGDYDRSYEDVLAEVEAIQAELDRIEQERLEEEGQGRFDFSFFDDDVDSAEIFGRDSAFDLDDILGFADFF